MWNTKSFFYLLTILLFAACGNNDSGSNLWVEEFVHDGIVLENGKHINYELKDGEKIIYLVRHAEKDTVPKDNPNLTDFGKARAQLLAELCKKTRIDAIYSTLYTRTLMTASDLAESKGISTKAYDPQDLPKFANDLKSNTEIITAMVVGHSNTTPNLAMELSGTTEELSISEMEYDNLYVVILREEGDHELIKLLYRPEDKEQSNADQ